MGRRGKIGMTGMCLAASLWAAAVPAEQPRLPASAPADQSGLRAVINAGTAPADRPLLFDWPMLSIGTGEYPDGPTGVTVFRFGKKVHAAVDVRGGAPGTVNTDFLRLGYPTPDLDAVVFAGGSWYGLEATTAVATALKDDGRRSGYWADVALSVGAIIYDFGGRRLNEIYPDKRLAQAAARAARPGTFPLGAHGAGRMAMTGSLFGCDAHSGQGGAFRQIGPIKVAAFTVVNAFGTVVDRDGNAIACRPGTRIRDLLAARAGAMTERLAAEKSRNTTVSLVVTNVKMHPSELQRLAIQVHGSMTRGIQPFQTAFDGDVLYAVSTDEIDGGAATAGLGSADLAMAASEAMWDAILASVPPASPVPQPGGPAPTAAVLSGHAGNWVFSPTASLRVTARGGKLYGEATGRYGVFAIAKGQRAELTPLGGDLFTVPGKTPLVLRFATGGRLIANPGAWEQVATRARR